MCSHMINSVMNCIMCIWMLRIFPMKANTHMIVMELVLLELDEYRNDSNFQVD